jgi:hypothetical protein
MNYKKCIGLCLALLLLVSNIGLAFNVHYCGGKIATVSVRAHDNTLSSEKGCCAKKVIAKDSCCKNKIVHFQKKSDDATLKAYSFAPYIAYLVPEIKKEIVTTQATFISQAISTYYCDAHAPPFFKLYHQFIFYA